MSGLVLLRRPLQSRHFSPRLLLAPQQVRRYALIGKPKVKSGPPWALPSTPARTRFAPSPTGYLHLGSLRTALFNYLLAQATGGQFIIRLEDTDQARFVEDSEKRLYEDLRWAGLHWEEGPDKGGDFGPYKQSLRLDLYRQHAQQLLESGHAFRCFCSKDDLAFNILQANTSGGAAHYPGTCKGIKTSESDRRAAAGEPHTIRFKAAEKPVTAPDLVYGAYKKAEREDDFIIMKSDGFPTYHFANVVDDHFMKITHVIRGAEWLISTPKHVELYNAFGWQPPNFAHVGLLVDQERQKLSKRDIDNIGVSVYRESSILPQALLNYAVLLGWDPNLQNNPNLDKKGSMTLEDMKNNFTLKFTRGDIVVNLAKLKHLHAKLTRDLVSGAIEDPATLRNKIIGPITSKLKEIGEAKKKQLVDTPAEEWDDWPTTSGEAGHEAHLVDGLSGDESHDLLATIDSRMTLTAEVTENRVLEVMNVWKGPVDDYSQWALDNVFAFYPIAKFALRQSYRELQSSMQRIVITKGERKVISTDIHKVLMWFRNTLTEVEEDRWTVEALGDVAKLLADSVQYYDTEKEQLMVKSSGWKFLRWALLNGRPGLSIVPMMVILGRDETLVRLKNARKVASGEQKKQCKTRGRATAMKLGSQVRDRYTGETSADEAKQEIPAMNLLEWTTKTRKVKISEREEENEEENEELFPPTQNLSLRQAEEEEMQDPVALEVAKGPFAGRPPGKIPQKSIMREPADVDRSPQFLDFRTWKMGFRHVQAGGKSEDDEDYAPALWQGRALSKHRVGRWSPGAQGPGYRPLQSGGKSKGNNEEYAPSLWDDRPDPGAQEPGGGDWTEPGFVGHRQSSLSLPVQKPKLAADKRGPFMPAEPIEDLRGHVHKLQMLSLQRKDRLQRLRQPIGPDHYMNHRRLELLKKTATGPMHPTGAAPGNREDAAVPVSKSHVRFPRWYNPMKREGERWSPEWSSSDLMESMAKNARAAELERKAEESVAKEDKKSMREVEQEMASEWAKRNL